jgi:hypothetical protein
MTKATLGGDGAQAAGEDGRDSAPPSDAELLQHLGAAVLLCWNELSSQAQVKILAQANDVIGTRPIPGARNEIVKLLLRHTKMRVAGKVRIFPELISHPFGHPLCAYF